MLPYESFTAELREQLQMKFLEISRTLACLLMEQGQYDEAEAIAERALSQDPFWTEGVRLRMDIAAGQGKVMKALRIYRRYEEQLQQELGIEPDPEMKEFLERVVRAQHA